MSFISQSVHQILMDNYKIFHQVLDDIICPKICFVAQTVFGLFCSPIYFIGTTCLSVYTFYSLNDIKDKHTKDMLNEFFRYRFVLGDPKNLHNHIKITQDNFMLEFNPTFSRIINTIFACALMQLVPKLSASYNGFCFGTFIYKISIEENSWIKESIEKITSIVLNENHDR